MSTPTPSPDWLARIGAGISFILSVLSLWLHFRSDKRETAREHRDRADHEAKVRAKDIHLVVNFRVEKVDDHECLTVTVRNDGGRPIEAPWVSIAMTAPDGRYARKSLSAMGDAPNVLSAPFSWQLECLQAHEIGELLDDGCTAALVVTEGSEVVHTDASENFRNCLRQAIRYVGT